MTMVRMLEVVHGVIVVAGQDDGFSNLHLQLCVMIIAIAIRMMKQLLFHDGNALSDDGNDRPGDIVVVLLFLCSFLLGFPSW